MNDGGLSVATPLLFLNPPLLKEGNDFVDGDEFDEPQT